MKKLQESCFFSQIFIDQIKRLPRASVQHNWFSPCCSVPQYAEIISGREDFQSSPFGCTSVQALKGDLLYLPCFPAVETAGYFHASVFRRTGTHQRQSVPISVYQR